VDRDVSGCLPNFEGGSTVCHDLDWRSLDNHLGPPEEQEENEVALPCHIACVEQGMGVTWFVLW
jgi:hypothetical protein